MPFTNAADKPVQFHSSHGGVLPAVVGSIGEAPDGRLPTRSKSAGSGRLPTGVDFRADEPNVHEQAGNKEF
jgi:hypothetical protein